MSKYNKNNIAVGKVASASSIRPELACVAFYGDRTVATDSFSLIEMSAEGKPLETPVLYFAKDLLKEVKLKKGETVDAKAIKVKPAVHGDRYPVVDTVLNADHGKYTEIKVNAEYLATICSVLKTLDPFNAVILKVPHNNQRPVLITAEARDGKQKARALLMPINR